MAGGADVEAGRQRRVEQSEMKKRRREELRRLGGLSDLGKSLHPLHTMIAVAPQDRLRLEHLALRIHALGPRALFELFAEHLAKGDDLLGRIERYAAIDRDALVATGGNRFPPRVFEVEHDE